LKQQSENYVKKNNPNQNEKEYEDKKDIEKDSDLQRLISDLK